MEIINIAWFGIIIWTVVFLVALLIELAEPQLVSIWFSAGAFVTLIVQTIFPILFVFQAIIFVLASTLALFISRPLYSQFVKNQTTIATNTARMIGQDILLITACEKNHPGKGMYGDVAWKVIVEDGSTFKSNEIATIVSLRGNKVVIQKKKEG